jgi:hypothetical protein
VAKTAHYTVPVGGETFEFDGPEGLSELQQREVVKQQTAPPQTLRFDAQGNPVADGETSLDIYKRAGANLLPSAEKNIAETAGALWQVVRHPVETAKALHQLGWEGIGSEIKNDLVEHYGSMDRLQKTFETDPVRVLMDAATLVTGGSALLRKVAQGVAKAGLATIPAVAGRETGLGAEVFERAGRAGKQGGQAAQNFRAGVRQQANQFPSPAEQAGQAIGAGGWTPRALTGPALFGGGLELLSRGRLPAWLTSAAAAGGVGASSPRLAGETMYALGKMERAAAQPGGLRRAGWVTAADVAGDQLKKDKPAQYTVTVGGDTFQFDGPPGLSEQQQRDVVAKHRGAE